MRYYRRPLRDLIDPLTRACAQAARRSFPGAMVIGRVRWKHRANDGQEHK